MAHNTRIKIAAAVTALFLAGISAAGLAVRNGDSQAAIGSPTAPAAVQTPTAVGAQDAVTATEPSINIEDRYDDALYEDAEGSDDEGYEDDG
jgi:hypothetical protein